MTQDIKIMLGIALATIAVVVGAAFVLGNPSQPEEKNSTSLADSKLLIRDDRFNISTSSAKATLVEFADFQCPACASAHPTIKKTLETYKGRVNYVFRHFPLTQIHKNALAAAQAAEAAGAQGKFWEMADILFVNQKEWSESNDPLGIFIEYAKKLGIDADKFENAVKSNTYRSKIQEDTSDGNSLGVNSTPTYYVDGKKLEGVPNENTLSKTIDEALKD